MLTTKRRKRIIRQKGCLYCSWCGRLTEIARPRSGRWSDIPKRKWVEYVLSHPNYLCKRPRCVEARF